jgi:glutamyl-tRNA reductase
VRSETAIARGITSLSHAAVALAADRRPGGLAGATAVVVGAGDMGRGVVAALDGHGLRALTVVNRTEARAAEVAGGAGKVGRVAAAPLDHLNRLLAAADVVFTAAETIHPLVDTAGLADAAADRSGSPLLVVDLGVPRNVDPAGGSLAGVELCDMDDLRAAVDAALSGRRDEVAGATAIVVDEVERYRAAARARDAAPVIAALRERAEAARRAEVERQRSRRGGLDEAQWDEVDAVTRAVVATLLHGPTVSLKEAAGTPRGERMVEALRSLFDL